MNNGILPITRVDIKPLRCSIDSRLPMHDSEDLPAEFRPVSPAAGDGSSSYTATPTALQMAREQSAAIRNEAEERWQRVERRRQEHINNLAAFLDECGYLTVSLELERLAGR